MTMKAQLLSRIRDCSAVISVVGLGYVGLPLAVAFAEHGYRVVGIDVDGRKVEALNAGRSYIQDIPSERLSRLLPAIQHSALSIQHSPPPVTTPPSRPAMPRSSACPRR